MPGEQDRLLGELRKLWSTLGAGESDAASSLLTNSPYAGFNPEADPYLRSIPRQQNIGGTSDFFKGLATNVPSLGGDLVDPVLRLRHFLMGGGNTRPPQTGLPTSDDIGGMLGANTDSEAFQTGLLGAPDPGDLLRLGSKMGVGLLGHTLFHGTPHKFDKFELSDATIGTGEGAQAYGHGLYFAENPGVAKNYQAQLGGDMFKFDGEPIGDALSGVREGLSVGKVEDDAINAFIFNDGDLDESIAFLDSRLQAFERSDTPLIRQIREETKEAQDWLKQNHARIEKGVDGHLYEVDIPDEAIDKMLDWDKPLSEQPNLVKAMRELSDVEWENSFMRRELVESGADRVDDYKDAYVQRQRIVREMLQDFELSNTSGEAAYNAVARLNNFQDQSIASAMLKEQGIPGIRYFDGNSRSAGEGTRNVVLFDTEAITQAKRDGETVYRAR